MNCDYIENIKNLLAEQDADLSYTDRLITRFCAEEDEDETV